MEDGKNPNRLIGLDLIKVIACFLVIVLHTHTMGVQVNISSIMYYSGVIAIPLFFMTNGFLLFGKSRKDKWYSYKKIGRILLLTFIFNILLSIKYAIINHQFWNPIPAVVLNLFFQSGIFWHFWFLGALILIYLLFPALDFLYLHKQKYFIILSGFLIFAQCFVDVLNVYFSIEYNDLFQIHIPQAFRIESHFSYFVLGGIIKLFKPKIIKYAKLRNVLLLYGLAIVYQFFMIKNFYPQYLCEFFYDNLIIICLCIILFVYISDIQTNKTIGGGISILAGLIMVIYIIHPFVIKFYDSFINIIGFGNLNIYMVRLSVVYISSIFLSWILLRIPYIKLIFKI